MVTFVPEALNGYSDFRIGGMSGLTMAKVLPAFWVIALAALIAFAMAGDMDVLMLGSDTAQSLGLTPVGAAWCC